MSAQPADVLVIGAGYTGLVAALTAAEAGAGVVVLEASTPGAGASGRNAGHVGPMFWGMKKTPAQISARFGEARAARMNRAVAASGRAFFDLIERHGVDCGAVRGSVCVARSEAGLDKALGAFEQWRPFGGRFERIDRADLSRYVASPRYAGGVFLPDGGAVEPLALTLGLAEAATRAGAEIRSHTRVEACDHDGRAWTVRTADGTLGAPVLLLATGAYGGEALFPSLDGEAWPTCCGMVVTEPLGPLGREALPAGLPFVDLDDAAVFSPRLDAEGRLQISFLAEGGEPDLAMAERIVRPRLTKALPLLADVRFERAWSGRFLLTADAAPHLLELGRGAWAARGCNGFGHTLGVAAARDLGRLAAGADPRDLDFPVNAPRRAPMSRLMPGLLRHAAAPLANRLGA